jgi:hypothetical protein
MIFELTWSCFQSRLFQPFCWAAFWSAEAALAFCQPFLWLFQSALLAWRAAALALCVLRIQTNVCVCVLSKNIVGSNMFHVSYLGSSKHSYVTFKDHAGERSENFLLQRIVFLLE